MLYFVSAILYSFSILQNVHSLPWSAAHSEVFAFFAILFFGVNTIQKYKLIYFHINAPNAFLLSVLFLSWLHFLLGNIYFFGDVFLISIYIILCVFIICCVQSITNTNKLFFYFSLLMILLALLSSFIALIQTTQIDFYTDLVVQLESYRRPGANIAQPNHLATIIVFGIAGLIYLNSKLSISFLLFGLLNFVMSLGLVMTESRTGLITGCLIYFWWLINKRIIGQNISKVYVLFWVVALIFSMIFWPHFISLLHEGGSLDETIIINTASSYRLEMWLQTLEAIKIKPWFGWGTREASQALHFIQHNQFSSQPFTYSHNILMDLFVWFGIPIALLIIISIVIVAVKWCAVIDSNEKWYAAGILIVFSVHSLLEYPFAYIYILIPVCVSVGFIARGYGKNFLIFHQKSSYGFLTLMFCLLLKISFDYVVIERDYRLVRFHSLYSQGATININESLILTQLNALVFATLFEPQGKVQAEDLEKLRHAALRFPWLSLQMKYGLALLENKNIEEAENQLKIIKAIYGEKTYVRAKSIFDAKAISPRVH